jgi:hypothetical protein
MREMSVDLPALGEADEADVGQQLEHEPQAAFLARLTFFGEIGGLAGGGGEVLVAAAAAAAAGGDEALARGGEVEQRLARVGVVDDGADGHGHFEVGAAAAAAVAALAVAAALGAVLGVEAEMQQRVVVEAGDEDHVAAAAAVAAARPAPRDVLLPAEGDAAVAAVAGLDANDGLVNKHEKAVRRRAAGTVRK